MSIACSRAAVIRFGGHTDPLPQLVEAGHYPTKIAVVDIALTSMKPVLAPSPQRNAYIRGNIRVDRLSNYIFWGSFFRSDGRIGNHADSNLICRTASGTKWMMIN